MQNYFFTKSMGKLQLSSFLLFLLLTLFSYALGFFAHSIFPTQHIIPHLGRNSLIAVDAILFVCATHWLLKRDNFPVNALNLSLSSKAATSFLLGGLISLALIFSMGFILWIIVPFHFVPGTLSYSDVAKEFHSYFWGNSMEELIFRGYLLVVLSSLIGYHKALLILALPFGLSHMMGLEFGSDGVRMVISTTAFSFVFGYAFLLTGTIWTAIGLHATCNLLLHAVTGLDGAGKSLFQPVFTGEFPADFNVGFFIILFVAIVFAFILFTLVNKKFAAHESLRQQTANLS